MKKEIKTLQDLTEVSCVEVIDGNSQKKSVLKDELKVLTIKWVKEDIKSFEEEVIGEWELIERWMKRLDISEEELK